jgi:alanine racemase
MTDLSEMACDRAWIEIDTAALVHNVHAFQSLLKPGTGFLAVIKADAYGHGAVQVAEIVSQCGVTVFGVATVPEGIALRQAGLQAEIIVLGAAQTTAQINAIAQWHLQPTLSDPVQAALFSQTLSESIPVHIKFDTGMTRLGPLWKDALEFIQQVQTLPHLDIASVYSHLATADAIDPSFMVVQQQRYEQVLQSARAVGLLIPKRHLSNSAGTLHGEAFHYDWVRVGLSLYGIYPGMQFRDCIDLQPVMGVKARIVQVKTVPEGTGISYGHRFVSDRPMRIAVVSIGYADGVPRVLSNNMSVLLRGTRVRQLGVVTMDQIMIDVEQFADVHIGEVVTLIGREGDEMIAVEEWAEASGTIPYEITCGFTQRLPRILCKSPTSKRQWI